MAVSSLLPAARQLPPPHSADDKYEVDFVMKGGSGDGGRGGGDGRTVWGGDGGGGRGGGRGGSEVDTTGLAVQTETGEGQARERACLFACWFAGLCGAWAKMLQGRRLCGGQGGTLQYAQLATRQDARRPMPSSGALRCPAGCFSFLTGGLVHGDMVRERERRAWEQEQLAAKAAAEEAERQRQERREVRDTLSPGRQISQIKGRGAA